MACDIRMIIEKISKLMLYFVGTSATFNISYVYISKFIIKFLTLIFFFHQKLKQLGVERLVLPAVPGVLDTWTNSFGFEQMTNFERSQFLDYSFLDFQGTVMCQKLLTRFPSPESVVTRGL